MSSCKRILERYRNLTQNIFTWKVFSTVLLLSRLYFFVRKKVNYADSRNSHTIYKEFKGYFRTKKRRKAAPEFPSMVEDSDIIFYSILGCALLLLK